MTTSSAGADLRIIDCTKRFGDFVAVDDLTLTIPAGSFFALLGPSGCGKTTTLRMVAGLEEPTAGSILIGDQDVTWAKPYKRPVNTVFQSYALFPHLDIYENVAFGLRRRGIKDVKTVVEDMLALTELTGLAKRKPQQLSGGQQQRVALARALINQPQVLLLDEPLGALDLKLRRQMQLELKRIQTEVGLTFVHVTHDQEEAMTMADTIAVMNAGRVEQLGAPADLYENPRTTFVANFLGQSNFFDGSIAERGADGYATVDVQWHARAPARVARAHRGHRRSTSACARRSCASSSATAPRSATTRTGSTCIVSDESFIGVSTQYLVDTPWGQELTVFAQNTHRDERLVPGALATLTWAPDHTFALDAVAGRRRRRRDRRGRGGPGSRGSRFVSGGAVAATAAEQQDIRGPHDDGATEAKGVGTSRWTPYLLLTPGMLWLAVFFVVPTAVLLVTSLYTGSLDEGYAFEFPGNWSSYSAVVTYWPQFMRSFVFAGSATILCLLLAYPLAYFIAFRSGKWKATLLVLVIAPFFTSFLIRTLAWKTILADDGFVVSTLNTLHITDLMSHMCLGTCASPSRAACSTRRSRSSSVSPTTSCRSWCCRSTRRWTGWTRASSRPPRTCTPRRGRRCARSPGRCRCRAWWPARCSPSSRPPATTSTPSCSAPRRCR